MSKDPAFLFYTADFLVGTTFMSMEERGQYITLICLQHQKGHLSEKDMKLAVGIISEKIWNCFEQDENQLFFNKRVEEEINKRKLYSESRRNNRSKTNHMLNICKTHDKDMNNICNSYVEHMENENENVNEDINESVIEVKKTKSKTERFYEDEALNKAFLDFIEFRRKSKKPLTDRAIELALIEIAKLSNGDNAKAIEIINQSILKGWTGLFPLKEDKHKEGIDWENL